MEDEVLCLPTSYSRFEVTLDPSDSNPVLGSGEMVSPGRTADDLLFIAASIYTCCCAAPRTGMNIEAVHSVGIMKTQSVMTCVCFMLNA